MQSTPNGAEAVLPFSCAWFENFSRFHMTRISITLSFTSMYCGMITFHGCKYSELF